MGSTAGGGRVVARPRAPLSREDVDTLLVLALRSRAVRAEAVRLVRPEYFNRDEGHLAALFRVIARLAPDCPGEDLPRLDVEMAIAEEVAEAGAALTESQRDDLLYVPVKGVKRQLQPGLVHHAYKGVKRASFTTASGIKLLKRFLQERAFGRHVRDVLDMAGGAPITNWDEVIDEASALQARIASIGNDPGRSFGDWGEVQTQVELIPTELSYFASIFDGGLAAPEVYGLLGVTGAGKSTLAHSIGMDVSGTFRQQAKARGGPARCVYVFSFEDPMSRMLVRSMAQAARIPSKKLRLMKDPEHDLLKVPADYDQKLAQAAGTPPEEFPTEYLRFRMARARFSKNYILFDMTEDGRGDGGIDEIVGLIIQRIEARGEVPGFVVIDSIDLLVENYLAARGVADVDKAKAGEIPRAVNQIRKRIGVRFGVPVFVTNQVAGADIKKVARQLSAANAGGAKNWSKGLDVHMVLDEPRDDTGVQVLRVTKMRRSGNKGFEVMLRRHGDFEFHEDVRHLFSVLDGQIVPKDVQAAFGGYTAPKKAKTLTTAADVLGAGDDLSIEP